MRFLTGVLAVLILTTGIQAGPIGVPTAPVRVQVGDDVVVSIKAKEEDEYTLAQAFKPGDVRVFGPIVSKLDRQYMVKPKKAGTYYLILVPKDAPVGFYQEIVIEAFTEGKEPVDPGEKEPPVDPVKPPPSSAKLYFLVIRPDGPAQPGFTSVMENPAWDELRKDGHLVKDFTVQNAASWVPLPQGTPLPAVAVLTLSKDGKQSTLKKGPAALPTTTEGILNLAKE